MTINESFPSACQQVLENCSHICLPLTNSVDPLAAVWSLKQLLNDTTKMLAKRSTKLLDWIFGPRKTVDGPLPKGGQRGDRLALQSQGANNCHSETLAGASVRESFRDKASPITLNFDLPASAATSTTFWGNKKPWRRRSTKRAPHKLSREGPTKANLGCRRLVRHSNKRGRQTLAADSHTLRS